MGEVVSLTDRMLDAVRARTDEPEEWTADLIVTDKVLRENRRYRRAVERKRRIRRQAAR